MSRSIHVDIVIPDSVHLDKSDHASDPESGEREGSSADSVNYTKAQRESPRLSSRLGTLTSARTESEHLSSRLD
jgi:hypothetical protein